MNFNNNRLLVKLASILSRTLEHVSTPVALTLILALFAFLAYLVYQLT